MAEKVRAHDRFGGNGWWSPKNLDDPDEDRRLFLQRALKGYGDALDDLLQSYWRDVGRYFASRLATARQIASKIEAGDLAQEVCRLVWQKFGDFRGQTLAQYQAWLFTIARNEWKAILRHFAPGTNRDVLLEQAFDDAVAAGRGKSPADVFAKLEELEQLAAAIEKLPGDQRQVVMLWRDGRKSFAAIARELHWSPDAVEKTFQRAVPALRRLLGV